MPLLWLSLAFLVGILLANGAHAGMSSGWTALGSAAALSLLGLGLRRAPALGFAVRRQSFLRVAPLALIIALLAGFARYALAQTPLTARDAAFYRDSGALQMTGWVARAPQPDAPSNRLYLRVEQLSLPGEPAQRARGTVLVVLPAGQAFRYGERLHLSGELRTPTESGSFSYRQVLERQGVYAVMYYPRVTVLPGWSGSPLLRALDSLRRSAYHLIQHLYPAPESALISGILLGWDDALPTELQDAFRATGTSHIIAISGFNMAVLAGVFFSLFRRVFSEGGALLAALIAMALYTLLVGAEAPVTRAALMSALALIAHTIRRSTGGLNALLFATAGMSLFNPHLLWDVGFQLSFAATLGLLLYASRMEGWARRAAARLLPARLAPAVAGAVGEYFLFTVAAQIATLPVILSHFGRLSLTTLLTNPLILPAQAPLLLFGEASVAVGLIWQLPGQALAFPAWALASYTLNGVALTARLPLGEFAVPAPPLWAVCLFYLWFGAVALRQMGIPRLADSLRPAWILLGLFGVAAILWRQALTGGDGRLHLWMTVQQGNALVFLQTPQGEALLINGLGQARETQAFAGKLLPPFTPPLAGWILINPTAGEVQGGLGALERYPVRQAALCGELPPGRTAHTLQTRLSEAGTSLQVWGAGTTLRQGTFHLQVLATLVEDACLLRIQHERVSFVLAGEIPPAEIFHPEDLQNDLIVVNSHMVGELWRQAGFQAISAPPEGFVHLSSDGRTARLERSP